jgi:mRNA interferase RelE/StbE
VNLEVVVHRKFLKDLAAVPSTPRSDIESFVFEEIEKLSDIRSINGLEKLTGQKGFYKIRFGDYRVGIEITKTQFILHRVMNRKEIYRFFP